jgi:hypothetical protein
MWIVEKSKPIRLGQQGWRKTMIMRPLRTAAAAAAWVLVAASSSASASWMDGPGDLITGAMRFGNRLVGPDPAPVLVYDHTSWCASHYRTYDRRTNTFVAANGRRYVCEPR